MSHLHIPDGVLPAWLWAPGWAAALLVLVLRFGVARRSTQRIAYEGAVGALMLAAMALEVPMGPFEYHLTLAGPVGVLLGPAAAFQASFIASALLALIGHGGVTLIGLNTLLLGAAATVAALAYRALAGARGAPTSLALATLLGNAVSGAAWLTIVAYAARLRAAGLDVAGGGRPGMIAAVGVPLVVFGALAEAAVAYGLARFLARVRPDLMPAGRKPVEGATP